MSTHLESDQLLIAGEAVRGTGAFLDVENPATEEILATVSTADATQVEAAIASARSSFDSGIWASLPVSERVKVLHRIAEWLEDQRDALIDLSVREAGCPVAIGRLAQVQMALDQARQLPALFATLPEWEHNEVPLSDAITYADVILSTRQYEPVGVVSAITPYNFPLQTNVWKVFSALATGSSVILRPSPLTPLTAMMLGQAALEAGLPSGVLNVVVEGGTDGALTMTSDPRIDCVSFTGSTAVGRAIAAQAAPTVKRLILELGGKSVQLYLPDGIGKVGGGAASVFFSHSGQACTAQTRVLVPHEEMDNAIEQITSTLALLPLGDPAHDKTIIGPVISREQRNRIEALIAAGIDAGAEVISGGKRPVDPARGYFIEPTVLRIKDNSNPVAQQEVFGPVISIQGYSDVHEAISIANDSEYGLGGGVYTTNLPAGVEVARKIRSGTVHVNRGMPTAYTSTGGYKQSGIGRERGVLGIREYQLTKHLVVGS